jgi:hypothetical protein
MQFEPTKKSYRDLKHAKKTYGRAFKAKVGTRVSRETFLIKLRETETYLLEHRYEDLMTKKAQGQEGAGSMLMMLATFLIVNVRTGSIEKWVESGLSFHVEYGHLAEVASWILTHPDFEFDPAWPYRKQEMIAICTAVFEEERKKS